MSERKVPFYLNTMYETVRQGISKYEIYLMFLQAAKFTAYEAGIRSKAHHHQ